MYYLHTLPKWMRWLLPQGIYEMPRKDKKVVYLTFDDGPTEPVTDWVLDTLQAYDASATFFLIGKNAADHPATLQRILDQGHSIGNHTHHHLNGYRTSTESYIQDIELASRVIKSRLFRPPYGRIDFRKATSLKRQGYKLVMWSILSGDFDQHLDPEKSLNIIKSKVKNGAIIVFHDSIKAEKNLRYLLPRLLQYLKDEGYHCSAINL